MGGLSEIWCDSWMGCCLLMPSFLVVARLMEKWRVTVLKKNKRFTFSTIVTISENKELFILQRSLLFT
jgi:hypothetical protein